jgi:hypothetical protein
VVERQLPKLNVAGSIPVSRSMILKPLAAIGKIVFEINLRHIYHYAIFPPNVLQQ